MILFRFTPEARADFFKIWSYIAADPATSPVQIIRIVHGMRDLKRLLAER